jgi:hypothetical protein
MLPWLPCIQVDPSNDFRSSGIAVSFLTITISMGKHHVTTEIEPMALWKEMILRYVACWHVMIAVEAKMILCIEQSFKWHILNMK